MDTAITFDCLPNEIIQLILEMCDYGKSRSVNSKWKTIRDLVELHNIKTGYTKIIIQKYHIVKFILENDKDVPMWFNKGSAIVLHYNNTQNIPSKKNIENLIEASVNNNFTNKSLPTNELIEYIASKHPLSINDENTKLIIESSTKYYKQKTKEKYKELTSYLSGFLLANSHPENEDDNDYNINNNNDNSNDDDNNNDNDNNDDNNNDDDNDDNNNDDDNE
jgi:hypothetical protein